MAERWAARDFLRCEWAKKYALVGDEGPKFMGSTTDVPPPEGEITAELSETSWKWYQMRYLRAQTVDKAE